MGEKAAIAYFEVLAKYFPVSTEEKHGKTTFYKS
jgi:hypothetical protein